MVIKFIKYKNFYVKNKNNKFNIKYKLKIYYVKKNPDYLKNIFLS